MANQNTTDLKSLSTSLLKQRLAECNKYLKDSRAIVPKQGIVDKDRLSNAEVEIEKEAQAIQRELNSRK
jgi:hypothetical protein